ncbi:MAG: ABC transporter permease, partial [Clostridium sp.]
LISKNIYKLFKNTNGILALAVKNVYTSKLLKGNINLLFISLLVIVLINSAGNSMTRVITEAYKNLRYDLRVDMDSSEYTNDIDKVENLLKEKEAIDDKTIQKLSLTNVNINDKSVYMVGIDEDKYLNYDEYIDWENDKFKEAFDKFTNKEEKGVILSQKAAKYINSKIGDLIDVEYKGEKTQLEVVGIVDGKMEYNSVFFLVKNSTVEKYFPNIKCNTIICNFKNSNYKVSDDLRKEVSYNGGSITTYEESIDLNVRSNSQIINVLNIFTVIAILIAGFGVLNNIMISFIQRKGSFAVLAALGLENKQRISMIIFESLYINILSIIIIMISQNIQLWYASKVTEVVGLSLNIVFNYKMLPFMILITLIVILVSIIPVIVKSRKFSIIESIRRE